MTQQADALRRAHADRALLDAIFSAAPVGVGFWTPDLRYARLNGALAAINRRPVEDHLGRRPEEVLGELGEQIAAALQEVVDTRRPVVDREISGTLPGWEDDVQHRQASYYPVLAADGELLGVGGVITDVTARRMAERERSQLLEQALTARARAEAAQVRIEAALEDVERARAEAEAARQRMELLVDASHRLAASMDLERTLREVTRLAVPRMADWCAITLSRERGRLHGAAVAHADRDLEAIALEMGRRYPVHPDAPLGAAAAIRTGEAQLIPEVGERHLEAIARDERHLSMLRRLGTRSALVVPLRTRGRVLGALTLVRGDSRRRFAEADVSLAQAFSGRAALALENARLYTERSGIARTLQRSLLPPTLPEVPGAELAVRYRAAGDQNEVGGDFYDVFQSSAGLWTAVVGDVAGKGAAAAAVTSLTRHTLRAAAFRSDEPGENLRLLNEALLAGSGGESRFCTLVYAHVRPEREGLSLRLSNAGHMPPLVLRASGAVERIDVHGTLVGALAEPRFEDVPLELAPGDLVLFYTDGVTELRRSDPAAGERELADTLAAHAGATPDEVVAAVERHAVALQGGEPRDDIALLAIRAAARAPA